MDRRQLLTSAGALALAGRAGLSELATRQSLAGLARALDGVRTLEQAAGPATAVGPAESLVAVAEQIAGGAPSPVRPAAVGWVAELATYAGHLHTMRSSWVPAGRWLDLAVTAATETGRALPTAHALGKVAALALRRGQFNRADSLVAACLRVGAGSHPAASYLTISAEAAARTGDRRRARAMLRETEQHVTQLRDTPPLMPWSRPEYYPAAIAAVLHTLGDPAAPALMADAISEWPEQWRTAEWTRRYRMVAAG